MRGGTELGGSEQPRGRVVIYCQVRLDEVGCLEGFVASGHALSRAAGPPASSGADPGFDLACAAVTTLLRTASRMLYRHPDLAVEGEARQPGEMHLELISVPEGNRSWLQGATDFLLAGLRDIQEEYPQGLQIVIRRKGTTDHGT